jgi:hypothetical protein
VFGSRRRTDDRKRGRRRWAAGAACVTVAAGGMTLLPIAAQPAQAYTTPIMSTYATAGSTVFRIMNKLYNKESSKWFMFGASAVTIAVPLITTANWMYDHYNPEATSQDVLERLDQVQAQISDLKTDIAQLHDQLDTVQTQMSRDKADSLLATCGLHTAGIVDQLAKMDTATEAYQHIIDLAQTTKSPADAAKLKVFINQFVKSQLGDSDTVGDSPAAAGINTIHFSMLSTGGTQGVIQNCGKAYLQNWRSPDNRSTGQVSDLWLDDRVYYAPLQNLVYFWQTAQAQTLLLLENAVLLRVGDLVAATGKGPTTVSAAESLCSDPAATASVPKAAALCESLRNYGTKFARNMTDEWKQVGAPYTDDKVVLQAGSGQTLKPDAPRKTIPTTVWARDPGATGISWATSPQSWDTSVDKAASYDGLDDWVPADGDQWTGLLNQYQISHPTDAGTTAKPLQNWNTVPGNLGFIFHTGPTGKDPYSSTVLRNADNKGGEVLSAYSPVDLLTRMTKATLTDPLTGATSSAFPTAGAMTQVWMPGESRTPNTAADDNKGLGFPSNRDLRTNNKFDAQAMFGDNGFGVKCMVVVHDGVLCDDATISQWWTTYQSAKYRMDNTGFWSSMEESAKFTVTPHKGLDVLEVTGSSNDRCTQKGECPLFTQKIPQAPNWMLDYRAKGGKATKAGTTKAQLWPVTRVPAMCETPTVTSWGAPTRCGDALTQWLAKNVPSLANPDVLL